MSFLNLIYFNITKNNEESNHFLSKINTLFLTLVIDNGNILLFTKSNGNVYIMDWRLTLVRLYFSQL